MKLLALGNPLLDLVVDVSPEEHLMMVKRFKLTSYVPQEAETLQNGFMELVLKKYGRLVLFKSINKFINSEALRFQIMRWPSQVYLLNLRDLKT